MTDSTDSKDQSPNALALAQHEEKLNSVAGILLDMADHVEDEELQTKLSTLAEQASPNIKGLYTGNTNTRAKIPFLSLMQAMTNQDSVPMGTRPGHMYTTSGVHIGENVNVIPIYAHRNRKKWGDEKIECASLDGETGSRYGECKKCPYGQFEKGVRPECSPGYSFYVVTEDLTHILSIDFSKTNSRAGQKILSTMQPPALYARTYTLGVEKKQQQGGGKGTYYVYTVRPGEKIPQQTFKVCDVLYDYFSANHEKALIVQREYARNAAAASVDGVPMNGAGTALDTAEPPNTDAIDFSESV